MYDYKYLDQLATINPMLYNELIYELYLHLKYIGMQSQSASARNLAGFASPFDFSTHNLNAISIL
jgi:hypothetical protein